MSGNGSLPRFVELMNAKAKALGLTSTHFENPHGLDQAGHVSSARDVTTLLTAALRNSFIRTWSTRSTATIAGGRTLTSTDGLIGTVPLVGAKTGHTNDAGWSQVAAVERNGVRITASLLGAASESQRNAELASLLTWGLDQYRRVVVAGDHVYGHAEVGYGRSPVRLVAARDVIRSVRVGRPLVERVVASTALPLPVTKGQRVGEVRVFSDGRLIARTPLVAAASIPGRRGRRESRVVCAPHGAPPVRARLVASSSRRPSSRGRGRSDHHRHPQRRTRPLAQRPDLQARSPAPLERRARARRRQGDQRGARAQAARRSGRRDRARRRADGNADRRGADRGGDPQRLRPHPRRVAYVDCGGRSDGGDLHGDQRVGPEGVRGRARDPARQAPLPLARRVDRRVRRARCHAGSTRASTPTPFAR